MTKPSSAIIPLLAAFMLTIPACGEDSPLAPSPLPTAEHAGAQRSHTGGPMGSVPCGRGRASAFEGESFESSFAEDCYAFDSGQAATPAESARTVNGSIAQSRMVVETVCEPVSFTFEGESEQECYEQVRQAAPVATAQNVGGVQRRGFGGPAAYNGPGGGPTTGTAPGAAPGAGPDRSWQQRNPMNGGIRNATVGDDTCYIESVARNETQRNWTLGTTTSLTAG